MSRARTALACLFALGLTTSAAAASDAGIRRLLGLMGTKELATQMFESMLASAKKQMPEVPANVWAGLSKGFDPNGYAERLVPAYEKAFTPAEIAELTRFFETPTGKKFVKELPALTEASAAAGDQFTQELAVRLADELGKKGFR